MSRLNWLAGPAVSLAALAFAAGCTTKAGPVPQTNNAPSAPSAATSAAAAATSAQSIGAGTASGTTVASTLDTSSRAAASQSTADLVKALRPSVVRVRTEASQVGAFGSVQKGAGTGTGIVIDSNGHILTNNHVVTLGTDQPAQKFTVDLADGRSLTATLVGREPNADLAILKVDSNNLTPVKFADPKNINVGEDVVAIGYALDLGAQPSVTKGVISALGRQIDETISGRASGGPGGPGGQTISIGGAIQTDTAINPGNSGGPLVNSAGEVVGINTAGIFSSNGEPVQGINFAVSIETVMPVAKSLIDKGRVDRGFMGINVQPITHDVAQAQNLPVPDGIGVISTISGGAAEKAGLQAGDIITKVAGREIHSQGDLNEVLIENGPNSKVPVEFYRGSNKQSTDITLGSRPSAT
jgi:serine protease Do